MDKKTEALKLALEALEYLTYEGDGNPETKGDFYASHLSGSNVTRVVKPVTAAIREALMSVPDGADSALDRMAENARELGLDYKPDFVLPGGGHVPAVPVAVYGYCPECGGAGVMRERRPNGDDKCTNGHKYPSSKALAEQPTQQEPLFKPLIDLHPGLAEELKAINAPAQRKPLTHEQRVDLLAKFEAHKHEWHAPAILIDMVEAAHGIKGDA